MKVRNIMTRNPSVVFPGSTIADVARIMRDRRIWMLPVIDDLGPRRLVGVITDHDVVTRCVAKRRAHTDLVRDHMTRERIASVTTETEVADAVALMDSRCLRRLPVVDAESRLVGVLTLTDLRTRLTPRNSSVVQRVEQRVQRARRAKSS